MDTMRCYCGYKYQEREWYNYYDPKSRLITLTVEEFEEEEEWRRQDNAVRVIQMHCEKWLDAPKTRDGKMGIRLRVGMRYASGYNDLYPPTSI